MIIAQSNFVKMHLAKLLVRRGIVSEEQIRESLESGKDSGFGLCESLVSLGYVMERDLVELLSREYGVPFMDIDACETEESVLRLVPRDTALEKFLLPVSVEGPDLTIAVSDPSNILMLDDLGFITGKNIKPVVASERSIRMKLARYYGQDRPAGTETGEKAPGEDIERPVGTGEDLVFDFTEVSGKVSYPSFPDELGRTDLKGPDIDSDAKPAPGDPRSAPVQGVGDKTDDTDAQSIEYKDEKGWDSSQPVTAPLFETPHEPASLRDGDGYALYDEESPGSAPSINGTVSPSRNEKEHEEKGSVLIVDFSPTVRRIMRISLERAGYRVVSAGDGMQALASINESIPDVIFVDTKLPHMDGYQLCKVIKSHGLTKEVPVVMLSGKVGVLDKMKIKMAGASDFLTKPFGSEALVGAAEKYAK